MALESYSLIKAAVQSWATRSDSPFTARIPDFIRLAEERIWRVLRTSQMVSPPTSLIVPGGSNYVTLPADWLAFKRVQTTAEPRIEYMAPDALYDLPTPGNSQAYTIEGGRFVYGQTPDANLTFTVRYYQHPGLLSDSLATNWLTAKAPSVYLYGALLEAYLWMKNPQKAGEYGKLFDDACAALMSEDKAGLISGGSLRMYRR